MSRFEPFPCFLLLFAAPIWDASNEIRKGDFTVPKSLDHIQVVDWNIDRGTRLNQIAYVLAREAPDLCLLQETDLFAHRSGNLNIAQELARRLKLNYVFAPEFRELSQGVGGEPAYQGQAILTRLPIGSVRILRFRTQSGFWQPHYLLPNWPLTQRRIGGRIALVVELETAHGKVLVYNAHLESRSLGRIQTLQLEEILADTKRYPPDTAIMLTGDLNTKYNAGNFETKLREAGWRSAFGGRTPRTHRLIGSLDWLLVHGPVEIEGARVLKRAGGSDHFPISAGLLLSRSRGGPKATP